MLHLKTNFVNWLEKIARIASGSYAFMFISLSSCMHCSLIYRWITLAFPSDRHCSVSISMVHRVDFSVNNKAIFYLTKHYKIIYYFSTPGDPLKTEQKTMFPYGSIWTLSRFYAQNKIHNHGVVTRKSLSSTWNLSDFVAKRNRNVRGWRWVWNKLPTGGSGVKSILYRSKLKNSMLLCYSRSLIRHYRLPVRYYLFKNNQ